MTMRARVEQLRPAAGGVVPAPDDWGDPGIPAGPATQWEAKIDALPCWFWSTQERELTGPDSTKVVEDLWMLVPLRADVKEQNRINGVVDRVGRPVYAGVLLVESIVGKHDHQTLHLIGIQSGV